MAPPDSRMAETEKVSELVCQHRFQIVSRRIRRQRLGRGIRGGRPTRVEVNIRVEGFVPAVSQWRCRRPAFHPIRCNHPVNATTPGVNAMSP